MVLLKISIHRPESAMARVLCEHINNHMAWKPYQDLLWGVWPSVHNFCLDEYAVELVRCLCRMKSWFRTQGPCGGWHSWSKVQGGEGLWRVPIGALQGEEGEASVLMTRASGWTQWVFVSRLILYASLNSFQWTVCYMTFHCYPFLRTHRLVWSIKLMFLAFILCWSL